MQQRGVMTTREVIPTWTVHLMQPDDVTGVAIDLKDDSGAPIPYEFLGFALPNGDSILFVLPEPTKALVVRELTGGIVVPDTVDAVVRDLHRRASWKRTTPA